MRRQTLSTFLMAWGALLMLVGISLLPAQPVALAEAPQAAPSPRPPIASTPERPRRDHGGGGDDNGSAAIVLGHITGTVIDQTTGAPAPGVTVNVGGAMVVSDKNGNYESPGIPEGNYGVLLMLPNSMGQASQGLQTVRLDAGARVVLHLGFRSAAQATVAPTEAPPAPTLAVPSSAVPAPAQPTAMLPVSSLPNSGVAPEVAAQPAAQTVSAPAHLPRTAGYAGDAWGWLIAGAALVLAGAGLRPAASRWIAAARETPLLAALTRPLLALQPLGLAEIARGRNLLLVGADDETRLLPQLIAARAGSHVALDLHATPLTWPCRSVQGDLAAERYLRAAVVALKQRQQALAEGASSDALQPITVVLDAPKALLAQAAPETQQALHTLLTAGRPVGRYLVVASVSDDPQALGLSSRSDLLAGFDYVIYLGAEAVRRVPAAAQLTHPAVAYHARRNRLALLKLPD